MFEPGKYLPNYDSNQSPFSYGFDIILVSLTGFLLFALGANCIVYFAFPRAPFLPCSILPKSTPLLIMGFICYFGPYVGILIAYFGFATICIFTLLYAMILFRFILTEFRVNQKSYRAISKLRNSPFIMLEWRIVQIIQLQVNNVLGPALFPVHSLFVKLVVFSLYMIIQRGREISYAVKLITQIFAIMSITFWGSVLFLGGTVHLSGQRILKSWKYHKWRNLSNRERKILSRFRKSCYPLSIGCGRAYVIRRVSILKFFRQISIGLFRSLLALKKK